MKLIHVVPSMDPGMGGVCQAVRSIINGLQAKGISSEVVSLDEPSSLFLKTDRFTTHALGRKQGAWMYSTDLIPWLVKNLPTFDSVIVHGMWNYHAYAVNKAMAALRGINDAKPNPSVYLMPHGMLDPYFQQAAGRKLKALRNWAYWKIIERHVVNNADGLLFTCAEEQRLAAIPFKPYHPKRQLVTGLGIEYPPRPEPSMNEQFFERCPQCRSMPYILFLGRIDEKKGVDLLVSAYSSILQKSGKCKKELPALVIAGPGLDTAYGRQMQQLVANASLEHKVFFPGMLTGPSKWGAFYGCDAFILPSHQENFGIAVVEALACGKPVLITNEVNIWREIETAQAGFVSDDKVEAVKNMLERWTSLPTEQKGIMGVHGRTLYEANFSTKRMSDRLYQALAR